MNSKQGYALKLETAFRINTSVRVSADEFRNNYYSALESGLGYLIAEGILSLADTNQWMEEYGFADYSFEEIIDDEAKLSVLNEMLSQLKKLRESKTVEE